MTLSPTTSPSKTIVIIGGGPAGLSCCVRLISYGFRVVLIEGSRNLGGRAASYLDSESGEFLDFGPHTIIESNHHFLQYLSLVGTRTLVQFAPTLTIPFIQPGIKSATFHCPAWHPPWGFAWGLLNFQLLSFRDRCQAIRLGLLLTRKIIPPSSDISIEEWFRKQKVTPTARKIFWEPLVYAAFNNHPAKVGVASLQQVLRQGFLAPNQRSGLGIPQTDWGHIIVGNLPQQMASSGGRIITGQRVKEFWIEEGRVKGVILSAGEHILADAIITAIPPKHLAPLFSSIPKWLKPALQFPCSPIISLHWIGVNPLPMNPPFAFIDSPVQWVFSRPMTKNKNKVILSTITSGNDVLFSKSSIDLSHTIKSEIQRAFPRWIPGVEGRTVLRKVRQATITIGPGQEPLRPASSTDIPGLFIAGDWTNTGVPPTLESAVKSGEHAAEEVARMYKMIPA